jgi:hypothetical protein
MGRVFLTIIIPLLLPTALYMVGRATAGKTIDFSGMWVWLVVAGVALAALTLIAISVDFGDSKSGRYVPPHVSGDSVVPGHIETAPAR